MPAKSKPEPQPAAEAEAVNEAPVATIITVPDLIEANKAALAKPTPESVGAALNLFAAYLAISPELPKGLVQPHRKLQNLAKGFEK